jgi:DnaK suppressor protein
MSSRPPSALAEPELAELRARLMSRRRDLERLLAPGRAPSIDERDPGDEGDEAERQVEVNATITEQERAHALLGEIDAALLRIERGTYGVGERSGRPISLARLRAIPWAREDLADDD